MRSRGTWTQQELHLWIKPLAYGRRNRRGRVGHQFLTPDPFAAQVLGVSFLNPGTLQENISLFVEVWSMNQWTMELLIWATSALYMLASGCSPFLKMAWRSIIISLLLLLQNLAELGSRLLVVATHGRLMQVHSSSRCMGQQVHSTSSRCHYSERRLWCHCSRNSHRRCIQVLSLSHWS